MHKKGYLAVAEKRRTNTQNVNLINFNYFSDAIFCVYHDDRGQDTRGCRINAADFMITHERASEMPLNGSRKVLTWRISCQEHDRALTPMKDELALLKKCC